MKLPVGIYVLSAELSEKTGDVQVVFRGTEYEAQMGINAFGTLEELLEAPLCCPQAPFFGYGDTPVIILPAGTYQLGLNKATRFRNYMPCAMTILGENVGISPNAEDLRTPNPQWTQESILVGSFYFGSLGMQGDTPGTLTLDGLTLQTTKVWDDRTGGSGHGLVLRNCAFKDYMARDLVRAETLLDPDATRFVTLSDIRADGIDAMDAEGRLVCIGCGDLTVERLYFANNKKFIGMTNYRRTVQNCRSGESSTLLFRDCLFEHCESPRGMDICLPADAGNVRFQMEGCTFDHITPKGVSVLNLDLPHPGCSISVKNSTFLGCDEVPAILLNGNENAEVMLTNTRQEGFSGLYAFKPPRRTQPQTSSLKIEDPHQAVHADFSPLDALYDGRQVFHGDFHVHTDSGGTSDGKTPLGEFVEQLKKLELDFAAVVDHKQMRHFFLPEWDETMLICGTEPNTRLKDRPYRSCKMDYTMIFPDKEGLQKVMDAFPEFEYTGGQEGHYIYARHTPQRMAELGEFIWNIGGLMSHAHPKQLMASDDPLDYYFGDHVAIETIHGGAAVYGTKQNRDLWVALLKLGKRVHTHGSSDTHRQVTTSGQTTVYAPRHHSWDIFRVIRDGDCTAGAVGIRMAIDGCVMGGSVKYRPGQTLLLQVTDPHPSVITTDTVWCLRVYTEKGLAYAQEFDGTLPVSLALPVKKRSYYRVELTNESDEQLIALSNPIWLDYEEE